MDDTMKELAEMLVAITSTPRESLPIEDLLNPADEQQVQAPIESDDEDRAMVEAIKVRSEQDKEDVDASEPVVPVTWKEAQEMIVKGNFRAGKPDQSFLSKVSCSCLRTDSSPGGD